MVSPMKTASEIRTEEKIARLKASLAAAESAFVAKMAVSPDRDLSPDLSAKRAARPIRRGKYMYTYGSTTTMQQKAWEELLNLPSDLGDWLAAIAKQGERITLTVIS